jgi:hypothetical protein
MVLMFEDATIQVAIHNHNRDENLILGIRELPCFILEKGSVW